MPDEIKNGADGQDYEQCLIDLKDKGDARYGICMSSYKLHHEKDKDGNWTRKKGHKKNKNGEWEVSKNKDFAGFEDWIPIFSGGKQIDSQGNEHDGDSLIDKAIESFKPEYHEPALVIGHPKDNSPAFGWVENLKTEIQKIKNVGPVKILYAKFKQVIPEFTQAVKSGLYKKRSASFYPDGRLRHVGFLGAMPPAVKGLADLKFSEDDKAIEFNEIEPIEFNNFSWGLRSISRVLGKLRDYLIEDKGVAKADEIIPSWEIKNIDEEATRLELAPEIKPAGDPLFTEEDNMPKTYTEEELRAQIETEKARLAAEFAEKEALAKADLEVAKAREIESQKAIEAAKEAGKREAELLFSEKLRQEQEKARKKEIADFIIANKVSPDNPKGRILPAWEKAGLATFMEKLGAEEDIIEFSETKKENLYDWFKEFLKELPKTINFKEFAPREHDFHGVTAGDKLDALTKQYMKDHPDSDYEIAFNEIQRQNPDLTFEYQNIS